MIKIRVSGNQCDVFDFIYEINRIKNIEVIKISKAYSYSNSEYIRVYIDIQLRLSL